MYWERLNALQLPHEELVLTRVSTTKKIFECLVIKAPRQVVFDYLQSSRFLDIASDKTLDIVELLEEYDKVTKEN